MISAALALLLLSPPCAQPQADSLLRIERPAVLRSDLLQDEDTDGDRRITVRDTLVQGTGRGDRSFRLETPGWPPLEIRGTYPLSVLLEELTILADIRRASGTIPRRYLLEKPADRLERTIRERLWDGLTRRMDEAGLPSMLKDEKVGTVGDSAFLYVPASDGAALEYYTRLVERHPEWRAEVVFLPDDLPPASVRTLEGRHGLLALGLDGTTGEPRRFVVPGGRFNEMYGWDSYFIIRGLVEDKRWGLCREIIDNFVYEIRRYGKILNANRTYYLTRSQPPLLSSMLRAVLPGLPRDDGTTRWVLDVLDAIIDEYDRVWTGPLRLTETGLSRYRGEGSGVPPEVEPGHFHPVFAAAAGLQSPITPQELETLYRSGAVAHAGLDSFFVDDRAMRESGHDTSYRLYARCSRLVTVDLNSLLFRYEQDIADLIEEYAGEIYRRKDGSTETAESWRTRANRRREVMDSLLLDPATGLYFDYDIRERRRTGYLSATCLYPLWAGLVSAGGAALLVENALPHLEEAGGIAGSTEGSRGPLGPGRPARQWDHPYGWSPHQMLAWDGLLRYGFAGDAQRLAYRWLYTIVSNAASFQGTVPEKFDVVRRTHEVFAEYGNVGTEFAYITREGFGWTNASILVGLSLLSPRLREQLNDLVPPESIGEWQGGDARRRR